MALSLEFLGERWTLLIVRDLLRGPKKFSDLAQSLEGIAPAILSQRLQVLESNGIVERRFYSEHPPRAEYQLTQAGADLRAVVSALTVWGARHLHTEREIVHVACERPIEIGYFCAHCDQKLSLPDLRFQPRQSKPQGAPAIARTRGTLE
jgi:DNA-binding HxlR family transcriptional regulator